MAMKMTGKLASPASSQTMKIIVGTLSLVQKDRTERGWQTPRYRSQVITRIVRTEASDTKFSTNGTHLPAIRKQRHALNLSQIFYRMKYIQIFYEQTPKARIVIRMSACNGTDYIIHLYSTNLCPPMVQQQNPSISFSSTLHLISESINTCRSCFKGLIF